MNVIETTIKPIDSINVKATHRNHTYEKVNEMRLSIMTTGLGYPVIIDKEGTLIDGALRLEAVKENGNTEIMCIVIDGSETEKQLLGMDLNLVTQRLKPSQEERYILTKKSILDGMKTKGTALKLAEELGLTKSMIHKVIKVATVLEEEGLFGLIDDIETNSDDYLTKKELELLSKSSKTKEKMKNKDVNTPSEVRESLAEDSKSNEVEFYDTKEVLSFFETKLKELKASCEENNDNDIHMILKKIQDFTVSKTNTKKK